MENDLMRNLLILLAIFAFTGCATAAAEGEKPVLVEGQPLLAAEEAIDLASVSDIQFPTDVGQPATVTGSVTGQQTNLYSVVGKKGEVLSIKLTSSNPQAYFNVYAPGGAPGKTDAIFSGPTSGTATNLQLPADGIYMIQAFLMKAAAQANETAEYTITLRSYPADTTKFVRVKGDADVPVYKAAGDQKPLFLVSPGEILERGVCENVVTDVCLVLQADGRSGWIGREMLSEL